MVEMYQYKQRAKEIATISLIMACIGLFVNFLGIILGPLAIKKAREAKGMLYPYEPGHNYAELGEIIGWCTTLLGLLGVAFFACYLLFVFGVIASSGF
jgi:uncharacterized membrane protein